MRNRQPLYLFILALVIVTVSLVLISVWGYHFYYAKKNEPKAIEIRKAPAKNSVQAFGNYFSSEIKNGFDSASFDSTDRDLVNKILEYQKLKGEIAEMLRQRSSSTPMPEVSERILQLQRDVEELKNKNDTIARENERLHQMVEELMEKKETPTAFEKKRSSKKVVAKSARTFPVLVSHLRFAMFSLADEKKPTNIASKAERISGSFQVNIKPFNKNFTIYIAIIQPDGKTLPGSAGGSKMFITANGNKAYSASIHFDNKKDNGGRLMFSIDSHNLKKGKYAMQIYHRGIMIGRLTRTLF